MARIKYYNKDTGRWEYADVAVRVVKSGSGDGGFSPIANVAQTDTGAVITITDLYGTTTATVTNGKDGVNGKDGKDGRTPVKGTDYYTDADKAELVSAVIAALPVYAGEVV